MFSADTHRLSRLPAFVGFNARMLLPTLLAACVFGAAAIPGIDVDSPADDRELFRKLEQQTNALAEKGGVAVGRAERLEQCKRARTDAVRLTARSATGAPLEALRSIVAEPRRPCSSAPPISATSARSGTTRSPPGSPSRRKESSRPTIT
jgi:hypothetical protein